MEIHKILAVRNDRFGEFLLTIPAICALKQNFPNSRLTLAVDPYVQPIAKRIAVVDEVATWENRKHTFSEIVRFSQTLKQERYGLCVIFNPSKEFNIISFLAGIPLRIGYNRKWGFLLNRRIEDKKCAGLKHEVAYNLDLLQVLGKNFDSLGIQFPLEIKPEDFSQKLKDEIEAGNDNFIVLHPWASNKEKEWPIEHFKELTLRLYAQTKIKFVLIGGKEEAKRAENFPSEVPVVNLVGKTTLIELAALLKKAKLLITNDSGPMHLAAVVGTPVTAIFRKSPQAVSARRWGPVGNNKAIVENDCLSNITVDEVLHDSKKLLD